MRGTRMDSDDIFLIVMVICVTVVVVVGMIMVARREREGEEATAFHAEHDILYGPELPDPDSEGGKRLDELGWHREEGCWARFT